MSKLEKKIHDIKEVIKPGWKLDKVKIKYTLRKKEEVQNIINHVEFDQRIKTRYESNNLKACKMNYIIETEEGNLYIGIGSNQAKLTFDEQVKTIIIEYNPNKIDAFKVAPYLKDLINLEIHRREIMSLDLAYDMFININNLKYTKRRINEYECRISHEKLETVYLRKMGTNGAVRIYDKTLEMNGGNEEIEEETGEVKQAKYIGDCTRYEIRLKPGKYKQEFNFINPWLISEYAKLHKLELKEEGQADKILKEIEKSTGAEFNNLLLIHLGYEKRVDRNKRKAYKELYENIKKRASLQKQDTTTFKDFNTDKMLKPITDYLEYITTDKQNQIIMYNILSR